jgi:Apea-like HEPN
VIELNGLHESARRRFEEQAHELRALTVRFREPSKKEPYGFRPNVYTGPPVTDENLVGDPIIRYRNPDGARIGLAVAEVGGTRYGLIGTGYEKLQSLVRAMAKVRPFVSTASASFLEDRIFEWVTSGVRQHPNCVDFVLSALQRAAGEHRVLVPISELFVERPIKLGRVTITTFPEAILQHLEGKAIEEGRGADEHRALCRQFRADFQGLAVADVTVIAAPGRAHELALEEIELVVGVIRFIAPANVNPKVVSRIAQWGIAPQRTSVVFVTDSSGGFREFKMSLIDPPGRAVIDQETWAVLLDAGLSEVHEVLSREERTPLEEALLTGMVTFGRAALTPDLRERLVWYCAGLESVLLKNSSEPVLQNLSERLALFAYDSVDERAATVKEIRDAYSLRSDFVHHGIDIDNQELVGRFARHGVKLFLRVAKNLTKFNDKQEMLDHIDRMKLSAI